MVYIASGYGTGSKAVKLGTGKSPEVVYENKVMKNHHGGVILVDGYLYGYSDGAGWVCQDFKSGEMVWNERDALGKGAVAYADGMLYCVDEADGTVVLAEASPDGWKETGRFVLDPQTEIRSRKGKIWTHPVILDGKLYLRDQDLVYCYDVEA
jgi:outer membrane protein assembly factor BamB